ncbi:hypothetical protein HDC94_000922 [Leifsonia sp. AK011]|uniref:hypothetical protein n=1 Tax=Leifsonia sp. AK011 TaxID=2723075 RepID=UPI0015CB6DB0|nr:hypothetical protein [Leifsonia sp. AK011]NYF09766.1 hypothetical protein [Leifsonia sp. AK011]
MTSAWNEADRMLPRPSLTELIESWSELKWESRELDEPELDRYLDALASTHTNGGYLIGRWKAVQLPDAARWCIAMNQLSYYELFRTLFDSQAFREHMSRLEVPKDLPRVPAGLVEQPLGSLTLDGLWAGQLVSGGAYDKFEGSALEAKELASSAVESIFEGRFEEFRVDISYEAWTPWFCDIAWDSTYVLTDRRHAEITVLCVTDSD